MTAQRILFLSALTLALAVGIGAFGAHGLKNLVTPEKLVTFETGVRYHFYHGFGLFLVGLVALHFKEKQFAVTAWAFLVGILLFSFNCYFYALSDVKTFAMIVPLGGVLFLVGWIALALKLR